MKEKNWKNECSNCHISEWNNKPITFQLDHINGDHCDNRIENLRFLCANCHSQTDTYTGKNIIYDKPPQDKPKKIRKPPLPEKFCIDCNKSVRKTATRCNNCNNQHKFNEAIKNKPSYSQLMEDLSKMNYTQVGKKYSVSDNSIRKWLKKYHFHKILV